MEVSGEFELARCAKKNMADNDGAGGPTARPERGRLRIYLGSAAGVGKTYAMLSEGHRRAERGADVVVGFAEAHGRPQTSALLDGLEVVPRATLEYRGASFEEMDLAGVLARRPEIALVDEFAHTNVPGSRNEKRWQDVEELLDAGIDVISAVNIQHLESLNDVDEKITGVPQRETVPDAIVRAADQVEMVDMTPEALRRRMAHGNIYPPEKIDAALTNYFRSGNLAALRELALLWLADKVDEGLQRYRVEHKIEGAWEARERVVVALTGGPEGKTLVRRAARIAARSAAGSGLPRRASSRLLPTGTSTSASPGQVTAGSPRLATTCQLPGVPLIRSAEASAGGSPLGDVHSSSVTESMPNASRIRSSSALSPRCPRSTLPAVVVSSSDSALARAACLVRRAAMSTTELTRIATATKTPIASALFASAIVHWWMGGVK